MRYSHLPGASGTIDSDGDLKSPSYDLLTVHSYRASYDEGGTYAWLQSVRDHIDADLQLLNFNTFEHDVSLQDHNRFTFSILAERLLQDIIDRKKDAVQRPMILFGYSFGGHIIKEALVIAQSHPEYRHLLDVISGIVFIGVMHNWQHDTLKKHLDFALAVEVPKSFQGLARNAICSNRGIQQYKETCRRFSGVVSHFHTIAMHETAKTTTSRFGLSLRRVVIVNHDLATSLHNDDGKKSFSIVPVGVDHPSMASPPVSGSIFASTLADEFLKLCKSLSNRSAMSSPSTSQPQRQSTWVVHKSTPREPRFSLDSPWLSRTNSNLTDRAIQQFKAPATPASSQAKLPCRMIKPYSRYDNFVGREAVLKDIEEALDPAKHDSGSPHAKAKSYALIGLGGVGKTQTALAYALRSWDKYQAILWGQADSKTKLSQSFTDFAYDLGLVTSRSDQQEAVAEVKRWFSSTAVPWLVIFDNADRSSRADHNNLALLEEFWPNGRCGFVLITSQDKNIALSFAQDHQILDRLTKSDALRLLHQDSGIPSDSSQENQEAATIVKRVDCLAFAISQVAWIIRTKSLTFGDFLLIYGSNRKVFLDSEPQPNPSLRYNHSLSTVWDMQFKDLDPSAALLLQVISFLDPDKIAEELLSQGLCNNTRIPYASLRQRVNFIQSRANLTRSPLVSWNRELKYFWVHRLVQETSLLRMRVDERQMAFETSYRMILEVWPRMPWHDRRQHKMWAHQETIIHHIVRLGELYMSSLRESEESEDGESLIPSTEFAELLYHGAWYYNERGFFSSSESLLQIAKEICEKHIADGELILADVYGGYGAIDSERNELVGTRDNFEKQHTYLMKALEKGLWVRPHVREALALGGLAQGYAGLDELEQAEVYYRGCIEAWKECPGEPTIYQSHLATCLCFQGKLEMAEDILTEVIRQRAELYGPCDTTSYRTGLLYYSLGNVLRLKTRYDESFEVQIACRIMFAATCGEGHHCTADAIYKVAWHMHYRARTEGEWQNAIATYEDALVIYGESPEYENEKARTLYMQGMAYIEMGDVDQGTARQEHAEEIRKRIMGDDYAPSAGEESYDSLVNFWSR